MVDVRPDFTVQQENGETVYMMLVNGKVVCTARTLANTLETIGTVGNERKKGYATAMLQHIEDEARRKGVKKFSAHDILPDDEKAVNFFKKNGYTLTRVPEQEDMLEGTKEL
jgi:GNAT superfamily N-acetyltransferase